MSWFPFSSPISVVGADVGNGIRVFLPDIGMFMAGLGTWLLCRSLEKKRPLEEMAQYNQDFNAEEQVRLTWTVTAYVQHYSVLSSLSVCLSHTYSKGRRISTPVHINEMMLGSFLHVLLIYIVNQIYIYIWSALIQRDLRKCFRVSIKNIS